MTHWVELVTLWGTHSTFRLIWAIALLGIDMKLPRRMVGWAGSCNSGWCRHTLCLVNGGESQWRHGMDTNRVIELGKLLPVGPLSTVCWLCRWHWSIFCGADGRLFSIVLKSGQLKILCAGNYFQNVLPYSSWYTLGTVFAWFMIFQCLGHVNFC